MPALAAPIGGVSFNMTAEVGKDDYIEAVLLLAYLSIHVLQYQRDKLFLDLLQMLSYPCTVQWLSIFLFFCHICIITFHFRKPL